MTKLLATTTLLLTLLVSPLMAEEKILKCDPYGKYDRDPATYYKIKSSLLGRKQYFLREDEKWKPFCKSKNSVRFFNKDKSTIERYHTPIKRVKGDNAISCRFTDFKKYEVEKSVKPYECVFERESLSDAERAEKCFDIRTSRNNYKLKIDFDTNTSTLCFSDGCNRLLKDLPCEVVKD